MSVFLKYSAPGLPEKRWKVKGKPGTLEGGMGRTLGTTSGSGASGEMHLECDSKSLLEMDPSVERLSKMGVAQGWEEG